MVYKTREKSQSLLDHPRRQPRISDLIIQDMERWVCIETADRKQPAWCEHREYRRYVFGPVNVKCKRARLDLTSHQNLQVY